MLRTRRIPVSAGWRRWTWPKAESSSKILFFRLDLPVESLSQKCQVEKDFSDGIRSLIWASVDKGRFREVVVQVSPPHTYQMKYQKYYAFLQVTCRHKPNPTLTLTLALTLTLTRAKATTLRAALRAALDPKKGVVHLENVIFLVLYPVCLAW